MFEYSFGSTKVPVPTDSSTSAPMWKPVCAAIASGVVAATLVVATGAVGAAGAVAVAATLGAAPACTGAGGVGGWIDKKPAPTGLALKRAHRVPHGRACDQCRGFSHRDAARRFLI